MMTRSRSAFWSPASARRVCSVFSASCISSSWPLPFARVARAFPLALLVGIVALVAPVSSAHAQYAPAGNAHPQREILGNAGEANPFGDAVATSTMDENAKHAFASKLDLSVLRDLAVYHNGRVKILESLARETVAEVCQRKDYFDLAYTADGSTRKLRYDPLFTFFDFSIDPGYYTDRPLIGGNYLTLKVVLEKAFPGEGEVATKSRTTRVHLQRVEPSKFFGVYNAIVNSPSINNDVMAGLNQMRSGVETFIRAPLLLDMVPPAKADEAWLSLSRAPAGSPIAKACTDFGTAWRAGDAAGVNAAAKILADELPKLQPEIYPTTKRTVERLYNAASPFEWGMWAYAVSLLFLLLGFGTGRSWLRGAGMGFLLLAVAVHFGGFAARSFIAERYSIQNQFESMTGMSLFAVLFGLSLALFKKKPIFAAAAAAVGFLVLIAATQTAIPGKDISREAPILNTSVLLKYHVTTVLLSYGLISLGMIVSLFYLGAHYARKLRSGSPAVGMASVSAGAMGFNTPDSREGQTDNSARLMNDLDKAQMTILQLAFWTLGVGILLGAWWADHSWGRWWAFDPKETWALVTWIIYLIVVHVRIASGSRGLTTAWLSVLGFIAMVWCYFGVNLLLPGLHAYA